MSAQAALRRYTLLLEALKYNHYPTLNELLDYFDNKGFGLSQRSLQRLLENLRYEFDVSIVYESSKKGYFIDRTASPGYEKLLQLFHLQEKSKLLASSFKGASPHIAFESDGQTTNIHFVPLLVKAIHERKWIKILHQRFDRPEEVWLDVQPYLIKEYGGRFYVIGKNYQDQIRTYGLERISELQILSKGYKIDPGFDPQLYFSNVIGVNYDGGKCEKVILKVTPLCARYLRTLPWHFSQELEEQDDYVRVRLFVHVNHELVAKILAYGSWIKVEEPLSLVKRIQDELQQLIVAYSTEVHHN